jgi:hypothetical protein
MNKLYGKIVDRKFVRAVPYREELPEGRGYIYKWISDAGLASGEYKEVLTRGAVSPNADALVRAGRMTVTYEDAGDYIIRTYANVVAAAAQARS